MPADSVLSSMQSLWYLLEKVHCCCCLRVASQAGEQQARLVGLLLQELWFAVGAGVARRGRGLQDAGAALLLQRWGPVHCWPMLQLPSAKRGS